MKRTFCDICKNEVTSSGSKLIKVSATRMTYLVSIEVMFPRDGSHPDVCEQCKYDLVREGF